MIRHGSLVFLFFLFSIIANADTTVTGTVDRNQLRPGDTLTFSVSVESDASVDVAQPRWPDFTGFEAINSWSGNEVQSVYDNGRFLTKRRQTFNLQLQANQKGVFQINAAEVVVDGQSFRTKPIKIEVVDAPARNPRRNQQDQEDQQNQQNQIPGMPSDDEVQGLDDMFNQMLQDRLNRFGGGGGAGGRGRIRNDIPADELFFVDAEVDKTKVYEGEQVLASYYIYTRGRITDIDTLKYPALVGFWKEDIELATRLNFQPVVVNGIQYNRALLAAYALFPIKAGQAAVDSYQAKCTVASLNPFGSPFPQQATKENAPVKIEVMPVPEAGKPADFGGAVGQFEISTKIDSQTPKVNQPVNLTIRFEGRGNGKLIELPKVQLPNSIEVYDSKSEAKFFKDGRSYKEFQVLLIPRQAGAVTVPSYSVSLFDPIKKSYYRLQTEAIALDVQPGDNDQQVPSAPLAAGVKPEQKATGFPPLVLAFESPASSLPLVPVWSSLYGIALGLLVWVSKKELGWGKKRETLRRLVSRRTKQINDLSRTSEWRKAATLAINLVYFVLGDLSGLGGGSHELKKLLAKTSPSFRRDFQGNLERLVKELELVAYAPAEVLGPLKEPAEIQKRISELEKLLLAALEQDFDESIKDLEGQA